MDEVKDIVGFVRVANARVVVSACGRRGSMRRMNTIKKRRSFEAGHFRKFLLVVDETPEVETALYYAASRMQRSSGALVMLYVIVPQEFQHWIDVRQQQVEEETTKAKALFRLYPPQAEQRRLRERRLRGDHPRGQQGRGDPQADRRGRGHRRPGARRLDRRCRARAAGLVAGRRRGHGQLPDPHDDRARARWRWRKSEASTKRLQGTRNPTPGSPILEPF